MLHPDVNQGLKQGVSTSLAKKKRGLIVGGLSSSQQKVDLQELYAVFRNDNNSEFHRLRN